MHSPDWALAAPLAVTVLAGCAPKVASFDARYDQVDVQLTRQVDRSYELWSSSHGRLGTASGDRSGRLRYRLPMEVDPDQKGIGRLYLKDTERRQHVPEQGERWGTTWYFDHAAWPAHVACRDALSDYSATPGREAFESMAAACEGREELSKTRAAVAEHWKALGQLGDDRRSVELARDEVEEILAGLRDRRAEYLEGLAWLRGSPAWVGGTCERPPAGLPPEQPLDACTADEAFLVAGALCAVRYGGPEACDMVLDAVLEEEGGRLPNTVSAPACGALVHELLLGEEYSVGDAKADALGGSISDLGEWLQGSDSDFWRGLGKGFEYGGYVVTGFEAYACYQRERAACRGAYTRWERDVEDVLNEPRRQLDRCLATVERLPVLQAEFAELKQQLPSAEVEFEHRVRALDESTRHESETRVALDALRASGEQPGGRARAAARLSSYSQGGDQPNARINGERYPAVESTAWYQSAVAAGGSLGHGFRFNVDFQPKSFSQRRVHLGTELGLALFERDDVLGSGVFEVNLVLGYQHYVFERWAPLVRGTGGFAVSDGQLMPSVGGDVGAKVYLAREFHLEAMVGSSNLTPVRASIGMGTNGKYPGYAALVILALGLALAG